MSKSQSVMLWVFAIWVASVFTYGILQPSIMRLWFVDSNVPLPSAVESTAGLLSIVVGMIALGITAFGVGAYQLMKQSVEASAQDRVRRSLTYAQGFILLTLGQSTWNHYTISANSAFREEAIFLATHAHDQFVSLLDISNPANERLMCDLRNNLGYYLAERQGADDAELSRQCAAFLRDHLAGYPSEAANWSETIGFIENRFPRV